METKYFYRTAKIAKIPARDRIPTHEIIRSMHALTRRMSYDHRDTQDRDLLQETDFAKESATCQLSSVKVPLTGHPCLAAPPLRRCPDHLDRLRKHGFRDFAPGGRVISKAMTRHHRLYGRPRGGAANAISITELTLGASSRGLCGCSRTERSARR